MVKTKNDVETFYDNVSNTYEDHDDRVCDRIVEHFILNNLPNGKTLRILDAGGGTGRFSEPLLKLNHKVVVTDISLKMLEKARRRLEHHTGVEFVKCSVTDMKQLKDNQFDVVLMINAILDYCGDHEKAIRETKRILKKGGLFMGTVNNRFIYCKANELREGDYGSFEKNMESGDRYIVWGGQTKGHSTHEFTLHELKNSLKKGGFKTRHVLGIFNLLSKYDLENIKDINQYIRLQVKFAEKKEYVNNSQDFFFVAQK